MGNKKSIWFLYLVAFAVVAGYTLFSPLLPFLIVKLGGDASQFGLVIALAPLTTVLFSPIMGALTDRWGRRPVILLGMAGMVVWFGLFAIATSMAYLYIGALIGGIFSAGAMAAATAYVADVTTEDERAGYITRLQAAQMFGAFLPPLVGGFLASGNIKLPFFIMAGISLLALVLCFFFVKESLSKEMRDKTNADGKTVLGIVGSSWARQFGYLKMMVGPALVIAFAIALPTGFFETTLPLHIKDVGLSTSQSGIIFSAGTFAIMIAMVLFVEKFVKKFGELTSIIIGMVAAVIFYVVLPFLTGFWFLLIVNLILSLTTAQIRPANITLVTKHAPATEQGLSQSAYNLYTSIGRIIGPILGGILYGSVGAKVTLAIAAGIFVISAIYTASIKKYRKPAEPKVVTADTTSI
jgi:DHA1 family multidrug resistance protein-like MFS transporter